jgi:acetylornithine deacetylase/succinyl-diaminopimelate desuccinylase-like protein
VLQRATIVSRYRSVRPGITTEAKLVSSAALDSASGGELTQAPRVRAARYRDPMTTIDPAVAVADAAHRATAAWRDAVVPFLMAFGTIPDLSPAYDHEWEANGEMTRAAELMADWARTRDLPGATVEVVRIPGLTPTVLVDVPASDPGATGTVVVYGHYDKQPPFTGWSEGRGPWTPTLEGDRLYGRGVADDGYALPSALVALEAVRAAGGRHARCVVLAEGSEESGSPHLRQVLAALDDRIGTPDLVLALDSSAATDERLWVTTSLRGALMGELTVRVLDHGIHSGSAGAVVPSSFRIARLLLDRIEDAATGDLLLPELVTDPPEWAEAAAVRMDRALAEAGSDEPPFPTVGGLTLQGATRVEQSMRRSWLGSVAVVGADGLPASIEAGAVLRPFTTLKLAIRLPPTVDAEVAGAAVARAFTTDTPYGAEVTWEPELAAGGWAAPAFAPWLSGALDHASEAAFGNPAGLAGEGGTIPFLGWLAERFPDAQLLALGVLVPGSNHHGPDESLHLPTAERVIGGVAALLAAHGARTGG